MPRQALEVSEGIASLLRRRRRELGLSLREVQRRASAAGRPIPFSTLAKIEQGRVDPGVKRLQQLMRLYELPMHLAGDLLDLEAVAGDRPEGLDAEGLYREGVACMKRGDSRKGLACLTALRERLTESSRDRDLRWKSLIAFAVAAGSIGKHRLSLEIVERLLTEPLERPLLIAALIQAGAAWSSLGSPEAALAFYERAGSHVEAGDHRERAWISHGKAVALRRQGSLGAAKTALRKAVRAYRDAGDAHGEGIALGVLVKLHVADGDPGKALTVAKSARAHAERHGFEAQRVLRLIDEGRIRTTVGETAAGLASIREGLSAAIAAGDNAGQFYAHYVLWKSYEMSGGDQDRAELELESARYYVRFVDDVTEETEEIRCNLDRAVRERPA